MWSMMHMWFDEEINNSGQGERLMAILYLAWYWRLLVVMWTLRR